MFFKICFVGFPLLFLIYLVATRNMVSPYHFILKFGKPGCGKTTDMCKQAIKYLKKGWHVYCNVPIQVDGVRYFKTEDFGDWTDDHSLILVDELNLYFDNRNFKNFSKKALEYTRLYRHNRVIVIGYSQTFDCDKKMRDIRDVMYLMFKVGRMSCISRKIRKVLTIRQANESADADSQVVDNLEFYHWWQKGRIEYTFIPKYAKYHDTYSRPDDISYLHYQTIKVVDPEPFVDLDISNSADSSVEDLDKLFSFN